MPLRVPLNWGMTYLANSSSDLYHFWVVVHSPATMSSPPNPPVASWSCLMRWAQ